MAYGAKGSLHALAKKLGILLRRSRLSERIEATYDYRNEHGSLLFQEVRLHSPRGFRQRRPSGGGWAWDIKGVRRVLFRLPELIAADSSEPVFLPEGERDVENLRARGLTATTSPVGAGKWRAEYSQFLRSRRVVVLLDNDPEGVTHADKVARSLHGIVAEVRVLELPGLPPTGDVTDWFEAGGTEQELLARLVLDLQDTPTVDLSLSGFSEEELGRLLKSFDRREKRERPETFGLDAALEAARAALVAKRGDVWALGDHRLLCGDAADTGDVSRLLDGQKADMAFTDPPYNVAYGDHGGQQRGARRRRIQNDALPSEEWEAFCRAWGRNLLQNVDGALYICMSTREWPTVSRILEDLGGHWSDTIIWHKDRFTLGRADYQRQYEPLWYGWREGVDHHWCGDRDQGDVWTIDRPAQSELHPTMKPLALVERVVENSSRPGDLVLDLFLGSGTTVIAAERTGRVCYGLEIDPDYCHIVVARREAFTGLKAEKLSKKGARSR
jgi:DNA modification methylase